MEGVSIEPVDFAIADLSERQLSACVSHISDHLMPDYMFDRTKPIRSTPWDPRVNWAIVGPLIQQHCISLHAKDHNIWFAENRQGFSKGSSALVAAMRAIVTRYYGETVPMLTKVHCEQ